MSIETFNEFQEGKSKWVERKEMESKDKIKISSELLNEMDSIAIQLGKEDSLETNSRCVSVDTISNWAPDGRNERRSMNKGKTELVKFRCTVMEKKLLINRAKNSGLTLSEYFTRVAFEKKITERLTEDEIEIYKTLVRFHNNFKSIGEYVQKTEP